VDANSLPKKQERNVPKSVCPPYFTCDDFDLTRVKARNPTMCPVNSCSTKLVSVPYRRGLLPFCLTHGIRLHSKTFAYYNLAQKLGDARLRNFIVRSDLARKVALGSTQKAESHRLGYEMSEDALSWNVFVSLADAGKLRSAAEFLIDCDIGEEPDLYLWGERLDVKGGTSGRRYQQLDHAIGNLENGVTRFKTEPDIMLVLDGRVVICIEAKFGSGNPLAHHGTSKAGGKPTDRDGLLRRYLDPASAITRRDIDRDGIGEIFHSQIFRNLVFASEMANGGDWHVVSLMSTTQRKLGRTTDKYSFDDPRPQVWSCLRSECRDRFHFRTWEDLYGKVVRNNEGLAQLGAYIRTKSAHYERAFDLE
jgi:hypothetical protein